MSTHTFPKINQKEYLKKYLSGDKVKKRKKEKKHKKSNNDFVRVKIIDDDINHNDGGPEIDEELLLAGEDAPQIVGEYIEENPADRKIPKWKSIIVKDEPDEGQIESSMRGDKTYSNKTPDNSPPRKNSRKRIASSPDRYRKSSSPYRTKIKNEPYSPKNNKRQHDRQTSSDVSPPRRRRNSDQSPPRKCKSPSRSNHKRSSDQSTSRRKTNFGQDSEQSPPKRDKHLSQPSPKQKKEVNYQRNLSGREKFRSDESPPRKSKKADKSPPRHRRDSDNSPPRRSKKSDRSPSPYRKYSDQSPPRRNTKSNNRQDSDQSPPRRSKKSVKSPSADGRDTEHSPARRTIKPEKSPSRHRRDSDQSPPRSSKRSDKSPAKKSKIFEQSPPRKGNNRDSDYRRDQSLPLKQRRPTPDYSPPRKSYKSPDHSSLRRRRNSPIEIYRNLSPTRIKKEKQTPDLSPQRHHSRWNKQEVEKSLSPPPTHKPKPGKTLEGKKAGLQTAKALQKETIERRKQEDLLFEKMSSDISGRNAEVQVRSTGRKGRRAREAGEEDPEERRRKELHEEKKKHLYDVWGKGMKQVEDHKNRMIEQEYESSKPLARYSNDEDLERHLKEQERAEDPMLEYMRQKRKDKEKLSGKPVTPRYEGPFPENRFNIRPGYRWDGVDRSNGYEKKYFAVQSEKKARQDEAYKYSVEDM